ncbi:hypothetical protein ABET51_06245 [Metabacillus fastidiosus]|uniref:hypothetical protein n=1 Tax=Metabacillus fastidiosus TaxID=1458 RepID=UPI002E1BC3D1|nr:hypothetical protein [Metabacillus fastidiosus]
MNFETKISIQSVRINSIDKLSQISTSSTVQIGKHVKNHRVEGFGELNGDRGVVESPELYVDDSDFMDSNSTKKG